jgi:hypothetical protein
MIKYLLLFLSLSCILTGCNSNISPMIPKDEGWGYAKCYSYKTGNLTWEGDYIKNASNVLNTSHPRFYTQHGWITLTAHYCVYIEKELEQPDAN